MSRRQLVDSMHIALANYTGPGRLQRFHYYATGLSWILLLERSGVDNWRGKLASQPASGILRDHYRVTPAQVDSVFRVLENSDAMSKAIRVAEIAVTRNRK